jgi:hypothetical protein
VRQSAVALIRGCSAETRPSIALVGWCESFQIAVLKVLAGHPGGRASLTELKQFLAVLTCSGPEWSQRMKRLADRAPHLDIFTSGYVLRDPGGWQITEDGRKFLIAIEEAPHAEPSIASTPCASPQKLKLHDNVVRLSEVKRHRRAA